MSMTSRRERENHEGESENEYEKSWSLGGRENQRMSMRIDLGLEFLRFHHSNKYK